MIIGTEPTTDTNEHSSMLRDEMDTTEMIISLIFSLHALWFANKIINHRE